jgi:hypothetical protein
MSPIGVGERRTITGWWALTCALTLLGVLVWIVLPGSDPLALLLVSGCVVTALGSCVIVVVLPRRGLATEAALCGTPALLTGLLTAGLLDLIDLDPDTLERLAGAARVSPVLAASCTATLTTLIALLLGRLWLAPARRRPTREA